MDTLAVIVWSGGLVGSQLRREQKSVNLFHERGGVKFSVGFNLSCSKVEQIFSL
jgi:hypothetical protein